MTVIIDRYGDELISVVTDHDLRDRDLIKQLAGVKYDLKTYTWLAPLTWSTCIAARGMFNDQLVVGDALTQWAIDYHSEYVAPAMELRAAWDSAGDADLYPYQRAGVHFLSTVRRALLADDMGTGKTVQTIRTLKALKDRGENPFPAIIVAPNNMTLTWQKEFAKWWPDVTTRVIKGSAVARRKIIAEDVDVHIINFESVRTHSRLRGYPGVRLKRCIVCDPTLPDVAVNSQSRCEVCSKELNDKTWKTVIVDEAHRMKNPKAKQTMSIWALRTPSVDNVFCLTGTPIANAPHDLWCALHLISKDEFPSRSKYIDRYCQASLNVFGGMVITGLRHENKDEFFKIIDPRMRRMPKEAVLPFLPKKTYSTRYVAMSPKQEKAYRQMEKGMIAQLGDEGGGLAVAFNPLVQLTRMSQFACAYAEIDEEGQVRMAAPSNKVDALLELLDDMGNEPLVVFAQSRQLIELACTALEAKDISFSKIVGGQSVDEREEAKEKFQDGKVRVILCTIAAGGIGITLTRSATACFLERSWSMVDNKQAEDRVHRIGSEIHDKVEIIDILSENTLEDRRMAVLDGKEERLQEVMRDRATVLRILGKE